MAGLINENRQLCEKIKKQRTEKRQFKDEIHTTLQEIKDYKNLKKSIVRMYKKWVNNQDAGRAKGKGDSDQNLHAEPRKQRDHLEESLNGVTGKLTKSYKTFEQSNKKIMKENVTLLQYYNDLKIELHEL